MYIKEENKTIIKIDEFISYIIDHDFASDLSYIEELKERASREELDNLTKEDFLTEKGWNKFKMEYSFAKVYYSKSRIIG